MKHLAGGSGVTHVQAGTAVPATRAALLGALFLGALATAHAQQPPKLQPLADVPPPPPGVSDGVDQPSVRIPVREGDKVEVIRDAGRSVLKVTPKDGPTYYLVEQADGSYRRPGGLDDGVRVPQWTVHTFD